MEGRQNHLNDGRTKARVLEEEKLEEPEERRKKKEVSLFVEADAVVVKHEEDCLVQDSTLMRRDQAARGGGRDNTLLLPTTAGPQAPIGARTTGRKRKCPDQYVASSSRRHSDSLRIVVGSVESLDFEDAVARCKETEGAGSDCNVKQRKGNNHIDVLRKKGWPTAVAGAIEKTDGKRQRAEEQQRAERRWAAEALFARPETAGAKVAGALARPETREVAGWEPGGGFHWRMCQCRLLSLIIEFQEIYSNEKEKVATLTVRSCSAATTS
ncbi:hypothetical protein B296_00039786 [Ensete ventricosum]|uniref:Uncharacterized protein n=1 Tax=Ensete ventricosum TaxID=4639 RepID=A0A426XKV2_ENSVE|nr:hypothetical protein B296_00039786 [Ensete ventricosum]